MIFYQQEPPGGQNRGGGEKIPSESKPSLQNRTSVVGQQAIRPPRQKDSDALKKESDTLVIEVKKSEGGLNLKSESDSSAEKDEKADNRDGSQEEREKAAKAAAARAKLRAALGIKKTEPAQEEHGGETELSVGGVDKKSEGEKLDDPGKAERIAATKAKMREALLSAALAEVARPGVGGGGPKGVGQGKRALSMKEGQTKGEQGKAGLERRASTGRRQSSQVGGGGGGGIGGGRRSSSVVEAQNTIWEFFEEGKGKKGTCRTCGYVVGIKHNHGGLTRCFQVLVFISHILFQAPQSSAPKRVQRIHCKVLLEIFLDF